METQYHSTARLPKDILFPLLKRISGPALRHYFIFVCLVGISSFGMVYFWGENWWVWGVSLLGFAIMGCSAFAALHETGHGTAFATKGGNRLAAFIAGWIHLYPPSLFRELHFTHHRHTHIPGKDPEISLGDKPMPSMLTNPPLYLSWLTGLPLYLFKVVMTIMGALGMPEIIRQKMYPFVRSSQRGIILLECWWMVLSYGGIAYAATSLNPGLWSIFIGHVLAHMLLAGYLVMEHNGLPHEGSILERTRTIRVSSIVRWVMWNMPYHAEHHAYPAVPYHALPQLHAVLKPELIHDDLSPAQFHQKTMRNWRSKAG